MLVSVQNCLGGKLMVNLFLFLVKLSSSRGSRAADFTINMYFVAKNSA